MTLPSGFADHRDAQRVMEVLPKRFGKYGLTIHPDKTRLVPFRPPSSTVSDRSKASSHVSVPGHLTFWALPISGVDLGKVSWVVKRKTARQSFQPSNAEHRSRGVGHNRHQPIRLSATETESEATRSLRVLRHYGKLMGARTCFRHEVRDAAGTSGSTAATASALWTGTCSSVLSQRCPLAPVRTVHSVIRPQQRTHDSRNRMR